MRKGRKATRKMKGGAPETINATTLNGVREKIEELKPRRIGLFKRQGTETILANGKKVYSDTQVEDVEPKDFKTLVSKHKVTNDKLVQDLRDIKPADKGKYFFQYV